MFWHMAQGGRWLGASAMALVSLCPQRAHATENAAERALNRFSSFSSVLFASAGGQAIVPEPRDSDQLEEQAWGLGGEASVQLSRGSDARGFYLRASAALQRRGVRPRCGKLDVGQFVDCEKLDVVHDAGASLALSYRWSLVALTAGLMRTTRFGDDKPWATRGLWLPELWARLGSRRGGWVELGVGSYDAPTLIKPGVFLGVGLEVRRGFDVTLHVGSTSGTRGFGDNIEKNGQRFDVGLLRAMSEQVSLGFGAVVQAYGGTSTGCNVRLLWRW